jgi:hypothetical protein
MKMTKITAAALVASLFTANAAQAATATGTASATVLSGLTITQTTPLSFGSFSSGPTAGTINHFGSVTGGVSSYAGGAQFGVFTLNGAANSNVTSVLVNGVSSSSTVTLTSGANSMVANIFAPTGASLNGSGTGFVNVTGTLNVAANQASGAYTGTYTVTANY